MRSAGAGCAGKGTPLNAPTWLRILRLSLRMRLLFLLMDFDADPESRAATWARIGALHYCRAVLRAERDAR